MKSRTLSLVGIATLCSLAPGQKTIPADPPDPSIARFLASPALAPVRQADRVEARPVEIIGGGISATYRVLDRVVTLDAAQRREAVRTVSSAASYLGGPMACLFDPGIALRFHKGAGSVQLLVCFTCNEVIFEDAQGHPLSDKLTLGEARERLLAIAVKAFPDRGFQGFRRN